MILASLFQFSFLCVIALANICLGFAIASRLGWGPHLAAIFQLDRSRPAEPLQTGNCTPNRIDVEEPTAVERETDVDAPDTLWPSTATEPAAAETV